MKAYESLQQALGSLTHPRSKVISCLRSIKHSRSLHVIGLVIVLIGLVGPTIAKLPAEGNDGPASIVGTWRANITTGLIPCSPPNASTCFLGLVEFHPDGTVGETDTSVPPSQQSWGAGRWKATGPNSFDASFEQLQFSPAGVPLYYDIVWGTITVSKDCQAFTWLWSFASYDFNGTPITAPGYSGAGNIATATRMQVKE